jgi:hypothetical protein
MKKWIAAGLALLVLVFWIAAAPRPEIGCCIAESVVFDPATEKAIAAVDRSADFAREIEHFPSDLPHMDDAVILDGGASALVTATDGRIWKVDLTTHAAEPFVDAPLLALGIDEAPGDPNHVYFCVSHTYGEKDAGEAVGLYRLALDTRAIEPVVLKVPDTEIDHEHPVVYADADPKAPELRPDGSGGKSRALVVCDNLEVSADGRRIYFSEPFAYEGATVDDAVDEAIALARNGRLWRHDIDTGTTRLIAEGFHFINGVLCDPHPGQPREESVIVTQTSLFRLTRFYLSGPKAGSAEVAIDGLTGTPDDMNRDAAGRLWLAAFLDRSPLLTWIHANAWIKPLIMRLPSNLLPIPKRTGVIVVSPDGGKPLYAATYEGPRLTSLASAVPAPNGIYLANEPLSGSNPEQNGIVRLKWPKQLQ